MFIAYFDGAVGPDVDYLQGLLEEGAAVLAPPVLSELLSDPKIPSDLESFLLHTPTLSVLNGYWERAGRLRRKILANPPQGPTRRCLDRPIVYRSRPHAPHAGCRLPDVCQLLELVLWQAACGDTRSCGWGQPSSSSRLAIQQRPLAFQSPAIPAQPAIAPHHAVTRDRHSQWRSTAQALATARTAARLGRSAGRSRCRSWSSPPDGPQGRPHPLLECRAPDVQRDIQPLAPATLTRSANCRHLLRQALASGLHDLRLEEPPAQPVAQQLRPDSHRTRSRTRPALSPPPAASPGCTAAAPPRSACPSRRPCTAKASSPARRGLLVAATARSIPRLVDRPCDRSLLAQCRAKPLCPSDSPHTASASRPPPA